MSTFSGLSTALSGLYANRRGMEVVGHNIANVNTDGYSRQRVNLEATGASTTPGLVAQASGTGNGVRVRGVERLTDQFLENRARTERGYAEFLGGQQTTLTRLEQIFAEPSDTALQAQLGEMWGAFGDLANRPGDDAARTAVLQRAVIVSDSVNAAAYAINTQWDNNREQLEAVVTEVNTVATRLADLNHSVVSTQGAGQSVNDLVDERDRLVMRLSELTGARAVPRVDGAVDMQLGGSALVFGNSVRTLKTDGALVMGSQTADPVTLQWVDGTSTTTASVTTGQLGAVMESLSTTLPNYLKRLDTVAADLATAVNTQHRAGFDLNGNAGGDLFAGSTAASLKVAISLDDPQLLAASDEVGGGLDGGNADLLAKIATERDGPDRKYRQLVVDLGVASQSVNRRVDIQRAVVEQADAARTAESGVNLDEEMTNMIAFERSYQAAAKVIGVIDDMLDTIINRMGV